MGGETEASVSPWTVDSLHSHLQKQIDALEKHHDNDIEQVRRETARALADADKATSKSEGQTEERFRSVNEFRGQLNDQVKTFISRETYDVAHDALNKRVSVVENQQIAVISEKRGAGDQTKAMYALVGFLGSLVALGTILAANGIFSK